MSISNACIQSIGAGAFATEFLDVPSRTTAAGSIPFSSP